MSLWLVSSFIFFFSALINIWDQKFWIFPRNLCLKKSCLLDQTAVMSFVFVVFRRLFDDLSDAIRIWVSELGHTCRKQMQCSKQAKVMMTTFKSVRFELYIFCFVLFRRENDWWYFAENYWSLKSSWLPILLLQHLEAPLAPTRPVDCLDTATQWPLHCGGVRRFAASCSFSCAFTVHKVSTYKGSMTKNGVDAVLDKFSRGYL